MATRRSQPENRPNLSPLVVTVASVLAVVATYFGYPGFVLVLFGLLAAGWTAVPATFTGKKDPATGYPTAAHAGETKQMNKYRFWADLKWRMFTPTFDWSPIAYREWWPLLSWFGALWASVVTFLFLPAADTTKVAAEIGFAIPELALPAANAAAVFLVVVQVTASRRRTLVPGDPSPGVRLDTLIGLLNPKTAPNLALTLLIGAAGFAGGLATAFLWEQQLVSGSPLRWALCAVAGFFAALYPQWSTSALQVWRDTAAAREVWAPRWIDLKMEPGPFLTKYEKQGVATVETFSAPATAGSEGYSMVTDKLLPHMGAGARIAFLEVPNVDSKDQPQPGTRHPRNFQLVTYLADEMPSITDPKLPEEHAQLLMRCAMVWAADANRYPRAILASATIISPSEQEIRDLITADRSHELFDDEEDREQAEQLEQAVAPKRFRKKAADVADPALTVPRSWLTTWVALDGASMRNFMAPALGGELGCEVLTDHRMGPNGTVFMGDLTRPDSTLSQHAGVTIKQMRELATEDKWNKRWEEVSKRGANPPVIQHQFYMESKLANGTIVYQQPFMSRQGIDPQEYMDNGPKLATALNSAPFVTVTGWTRAPGSRPGDRHAQALTVHWSHSPVPANPDTLEPGPRDAARWVLSGRMNDAFTAARMARPEVVRVRELTAPDSPGHIWEIVLRLYGGVSLADVRGASQRLRQALGSEWLRVTSADDGCVIVAGVSPKRAKLAKPRRDTAYLAALDWEQAWLDSSVSGVGGLTPKLIDVGCLPKNTKVQVLTFELPSGLDVTTVKAAARKLENSTRNAFVDVRRGAEPGTVTVLACEVEPLPEKTGFDFDEVERSDGIPFATGIEGEPVVFYPTDSPHALLAGVTGAGKSVLAQNFIYGFLSKGAEVYVIDPVKGAADFKFAQNHAVALATTPFEAAGTMKHIYAEVVRRKDANAKAGVGSYLDLENPPPPIVVMIDEFTSLMGTSMVPKPSDDPTMDLERDAIIAENNARMEIGVFAGKLAREARSAGVTLLLGTQKLSAKMLDSVPGGSDLKTNLARVLLGKASSGDRMSALRAFDDAPVFTGDIPKGRGLWESLTSSSIAVQCWYAPQADLEENLLKVRSPLAVGDRLDLTQFAPKAKKPTAEFAPRTRKPAPDVVVELGEMAFSLDDLDMDDVDEAPETPVIQPEADVFDEFVALNGGEVEPAADIFGELEIIPEIPKPVLPEPQAVSMNLFADTLPGTLPVVEVPLDLFDGPDDPFGDGLPKVAAQFVSDDDPFA